MALEPRSRNSLDLQPCGPGSLPEDVWLVQLGSLEGGQGALTDRPPRTMRGGGEECYDQK